VNWAPHPFRKTLSRALLAGGAALLLTVSAPAFGQDQPDQDAPAQPWCQSGAPEASPDSFSLDLIYIPSEYAQVKARNILASSNYQALSKEMAADLGVPPEYVQANAYLVRAGGYFQPEGKPDRSVQAYYDAGDGLLQINTYAASTSNAPVNWAAVVVAPGEVNAVRSICLQTNGG
jgi:hypothetical protein